MNKLKLLCGTVIQGLKRAGLIPQRIAASLKQRRRQIVLNEQEIERLDRIRHPWKYLGK